MSTGKLLGIAIRRQSRAPMEEVTSTNVTLEFGLESDFRGKRGGAQVTVMTREDWEAACAEVQETLPWTIRRANLLVEGVHLAHTVGSMLQIGEIQLQITGETDPCYRMDEQCSGLQGALTPDWRGGVCCQVTRGGQLAVGADVTLTSLLPS